MIIKGDHRTARAIDRLLILIDTYGPFFVSQGIPKRVFFLRAREATIGNAKGRTRGYAGVGRSTVFKALALNLIEVRDAGLFSDTPQSFGLSAKGKRRVDQIKQGKDDEGSGEGGEDEGRADCDGDGAPDDGAREKAIPSNEVRGAVNDTMGRRRVDGETSRRKSSVVRPRPHRRKVPPQGDAAGAQPHGARKALFPALHFPDAVETALRAVVVDHRRRVAMAAERRRSETEDEALARRRCLDWESEQREAYEAARDFTTYHGGL